MIIIIIFITGGKWFYFLNDGSNKINSNILELSLIYAIGIFGQTISLYSSTILKSIGMQKIMTVCCYIGYCFIGLSFSFYFGFNFDGKLMGIWLGRVLGNYSIVILSFIVFGVSKMGKSI